MREVEVVLIESIHWKNWQEVRGAEIERGELFLCASVHEAFLRDLYSDRPRLTVVLDPAFLSPRAEEVRGAFPGARVTVNRPL